MAGLGSVALHPAGSTLARVGHSNADLTVALFSAGGLVGYALGPLAILAFVGIFGLEATPWLLLPGLVVAGLLYLTLPDTTAAPHQGHAVRFNPAIPSRPLAPLSRAGALTFLPFLAVTCVVLHIDPQRTATSQ